jgi:predicted TIM-barrel enzyme
MDAATKRTGVRQSQDVSIRSLGAASLVADVPLQTSGTRSARQAISRFGVVAVPLAAAVALCSTPTSGVVQHVVFANAGGSSSGPRDIAWGTEDAWTLRQTWTTEAEIDALNALFHLSPSEGFSLDLPDA